MTASPGDRAAVTSDAVRGKGTHLLRTDVFSTLVVVLSGNHGAV
jgi:hypothetical protein